VRRLIDFIIYVMKIILHWQSHAARIGENK